MFPFYLLGQFNPIYQGTEREFTLSALSPGVTYKVRVASESKVGKGSWSPVLQAATLPVSPKDCQPPSCRKAEPRCLHLEWGKLDFHNNISIFLHHGIRLFYYIMFHNTSL